MTNQEAFESARAGDWIAESFARVGDVFDIGGTSTGYSSFADCLTDGQSIFYAAFDENDNREAGLAVWDANARTLTPVEIHATLQAGKFTKGDPDPVPFNSGGTITGTFNATGFNTIWRHVFEKGNPHETQADEIDQSNSKLGDTVQEALDKIAAYVIQLDPDGNTDIDWGDLDGLKDLLDSKAEQDDLEQEIQDRIDGDKALQDQIDALDPDGDRKVDWTEIEGKPTEFPPEAHNQGWDTITGKPADYPPSSHGHAWGEITGTPADFPPSAHGHAWSEITGKPTEFPPEDHGHEIADVDGLQDALDAAGGTPAWDDVTGKPAEFPPEAHNQDWSTITNTPSEYPPEAHTHEQSEVDGLELRLEAIEDSITSGGGFVDAPNDGQLYGRQSEAWAVVPSGGASSWNELTDKPADFPPSDHTHDIDDVNGLQDALDAAGAAPAWDDVTGKPAEFPPEAHQHGWDDVTGKPADYPPSAHNHDGVYQPVGDYIGEAPNDGEEYARKNEGWVKLQDHNYTGADAVKLTGDQSVAGHKTWTGVATFGDTVTMRGTLNGDDTANFQNAVTAGSFVKTGGTSDQYLMADGSVSTGSGGDGTGSSVHIGENPPDSPEEGQQWMEVPISGDATMWIYDGDKWLQQPGGKDGADGEDGGIEEAPNDGLQYARQSEGWAEVKGGLWTDNGDTSISYTAGDVLIAKADAGAGALSIGQDAGGTNQGENAVALGRGAGYENQGASAVAIGVAAGETGQASNSIVISARGSAKNVADPYCIWIGGHNDKRLYYNGADQWSFAGGGLKVDGVPVTTSLVLINTLSTLRNATKDETTLEGMRDALADAIGGLIQNLEHEIDTQEISDE